LQAYKKLIMENSKQIKTALISVYHKDNLAHLVEKLNSLDVKIFSTGGTKDFIEGLKINVTAVEELTTYPSILGGRVKTLHPKIFGGILARREEPKDMEQLMEYQIPEIDLVIVDLYPFEETVASDASQAEIIEKIDIGGISLIRAAAKNYADVVINSSRKQYPELLSLLENQQGSTTLNDRKRLAGEAFNISSHYDTAIFKFFNKDNLSYFKESQLKYKSLRYGENPHQKGKFFGDFSEMFEQLHGKEISYNNILDIDAAIGLIAEFNEPTVAILKHNNACGISSRPELVDAWKAALAADPISAFGGVVISNKNIDLETAKEINTIFFELIIAPKYDANALEILKQKKNRIILVQKQERKNNTQFRSSLNGVLVQDYDYKIETVDDLTVVTKISPSENEIDDLLFANKIVKHSKSNTIVLAKNKQLIASGVGETSRIDALKHAIEKANNFEFDLSGAVMSSDAFFPFADSVEIANKSGIKCVIQPGGSVRDNETIEYCDKNTMSMVFTGIRHFKH